MHLIVLPKYLLIKLPAVYPFIQLGRVVWLASIELLITKATRLCIMSYVPYMYEIWTICINTNNNSNICHPFLRICKIYQMGIFSGRQMRLESTRTIEKTKLIHVVYVFQLVLIRFPLYLLRSIRMFFRWRETTAAMKMNWLRQLYSSE